MERPEEIIDENVEAYNQTVDEYYENCKDLEPVEVEIRENFCELIGKSGRILDLACGPGRDVKFFSDLGYKVVGVDKAVKMLDFAKNIAPKAEFLEMDMRKLEFEDDSFDGVFFSAGLLCIPKEFAKETLSGIKRVLKTEGILFICVKEGSGEGVKLDKRYGLEKFYAYYSKEEILSLLEDTGFEIISTRTPDLKSEYHTHFWIDIIAKSS